MISHHPFLISEIGGIHKILQSFYLLTPGNFYPLTFKLLDLPRSDIHLGGSNFAGATGIPYPSLLIERSS